MVLSHRLTFSLASLVLILGLVFATAPVMAQSTDIDAAAQFGTTDAPEGAAELELGAGTTIPANGYLIIHRGPRTTAAAETNTDGLPLNLPANTVTAQWNAMPDLEEVFFGDGGGTIALKAMKTAMGGTPVDVVPAGSDFRIDHDGMADTDTRDVAVNDAAITEIMWALDKSQEGTATDVNRQWIEIHNRLAQPLPVAGLLIHIKSGRPGDSAISKEDVKTVVGAVSAADTTLEVKTRGRTVLDWISNVDGNGWNTPAPGQSGFVAADADDRIDLVSMYRNRKKLGKTEGANRGHWMASTNVYLAGYKGTPGAAERIGPKTFIPDDPALTVVFNEVANFPTAEKDYEWIELLVSEGDPNFKNWEVSLLTRDGGDKKDMLAETTLFVLPELNKDRIKGPDGDNKILLITATDPAGETDHPLAAGYNVMKDDNDQQGGIDKNIRYYVADDWKTELPNYDSTDDDDEDEFVLMLRSNKDKVDHEAIQDVAGMHSNLQKSTVDFFSELWPLRGYPKPDIALNALEVGKVHRRQHDDIAGTRTTDKANNADHVAMRDIGYTGVGYKRQADDDAQNGGTPGYPNDVVKDKATDLADDAMVTISEIMYQTGNRLPQWIELYNGSMMQAVKLDGWKLKIENSRDDDDVDIRTPAVTIDFDGGMIIPPNQTMLIVSAKAVQSTDEVKVDQRVIDLWSTEKSTLEVTERRYQLLSTTAFKLTLMQKDAKATDDPVDVAGNLGDDGMAMWALPAMDEDADGRSSIIRRYNTGRPPGGGKNAGMAQDGTMPVWSGMGSLGDAGGLGNAGWVLASASDRQFEATYYGHRDDIGTPGYHGGGVLPVSLSKFRPERMKDTGQIVIRWVTESELNNAGFNILRSDTRDGEFTKLNTKLIAGQGTTSERTAYEYADTSAKPNVVYYYQIQDVSLEGQVNTLATTHLRGNVTAAGKLTTTWGELKLQD